MTGLLRYIWLPPLAVLLGAAMPADRGYDLVRQGNAAFERGDFQNALALYAQAEDAIPDPGLLAFNEGTVLYQLACAERDAATRRLRFREAERHYRCCLADATSPRRTRALYDLGNTLVEQAGPRDVERLREAVSCYQQSLASADIEPMLSEDARHNLQIAKVRLQRAEAARQRSPAAPDDPEDSRPSVPKPDGDNGSEGPGLEPGAAQGDLTGTAAPGKMVRDPGSARSTNNPTPGDGGAPPIPDNEKLVPMSPEETRQFVENAADRIAKDRHKHWQELSPPASRPALDW